MRVGWLGSWLAREEVEWIESGPRDEDSAPVDGAIPKRCFSNDTEAPTIARSNAADSS